MYLQMCSLDQRDTLCEGMLHSTALPWLWVSHAQPCQALPSQMAVAPGHALLLRFPFFPPESPEDHRKLQQLVPGHPPNIPSL